MPIVFTKIFDQIFDSSIASDATVRHTFMDLLVLADSEGVVDMTLDAIARRTNVSPEMVGGAIARLCEPDPASRSKKKEGRRLIQLDSHRDWGWIIVNYDHYRQVRDEEARRAYFREHKAAYRKKKAKLQSKLSETKTDSPTCPPKVTRRIALSTDEEDGEADKEEDGEAVQRANAEAAIKPDRLKAPPKVYVVFPENLDTPKFREAWEKYIEYRKRSKFKVFLPESIREKLASLAEHGPDVAAIAIGETIGNGWQGIFPEKVRVASSGDKSKTGMREKISVPIMENGVTTWT